MSVMIILLSYHFKSNELVSHSWCYLRVDAAVNDLVMWVNHFRMILYVNTILLMVYYVDISEKYNGL